MSEAKTQTIDRHSACSVLEGLRSRGVTLTPAIDWAGPPEVEADGTLDLIRLHKPALLRLLVNPYRHTCTTNPHRQQVCNLLADVYDRDPLRCLDLKELWYRAIDTARAAKQPDPDATARA